MREDAANEIRLAEVVDVLRQHKTAMLVAPVLLLLLAIIYLHWSEAKYSVTLKVTPTNSATSTLPAGLEGLAGLTGLSLPSSKETMDFDLYLEGLRSRETSAAVAADAELVRQLFSDEWDDVNGAWIEPSGFVVTLKSLLKAIFGIPRPAWGPPSAEAVNEFLNDELRIVRDTKGPVVTIMLEHGRPHVGQALLAKLHDVVDTALRQKELDRTGAYVSYLRGQLSNVSVTEYRQALHDILAEQEKRRMVASSNLPFAAEPFGHPTVSVRPTSPRPLLVVFSSLLLGVLAGIVAAFVLHQGRRSSRPAS